jgi:hypothetical protein
MTKYLATLRALGARVTAFSLERANGSAKHLRRTRRAWHRLGLFLIEVSGVVLVSFGIAQWSWPCAVVVGGLVLVGVVEVRPSSAPKMPDLPPPEDILRHQAENAAVILNAERYGLGFVDAAALEKLTITECEQLVMAARKLGVKT